jgi:hypothetical protein
MGSLLKSIRIRFSGTQATDTFQLSPDECLRFQSDWKCYLNGLGARGGEYTSQDGDRTVLLSLNFTQIAYTEPCKA